MKKIWMIIGIALFLPCSVCAVERFIEIRAKKFQYTPHIIKVHKGDTIKIRLISEDVTHGFYLDGYGVRTRAYPGQDGSVSFVANKTGRFSFRCSVTCGTFHPYMIGYLHVGPNIRFYFYVIVIIGLMIMSLVMVFSKGKKTDVS